MNQYTVKSGLDISEFSLALPYDRKKLTHLRMNIYQRVHSFFLGADSKRQFFTVAEQILSSATSFLASITVAKFAGLEWLGIFSFMLVFVSLANSAVFTLFLRQMTLEISTMSHNRRSDTFFATVVMMLVFFVVTIASTYSVITLIPSDHLLLKFGPEAVSCVIFVVSNCLFDACKQFFYVTNNHKRSLQYTVVYSITLCLLLIFSVLTSDKNALVNNVLLSFSISFCVSFLFNFHIHRELANARWHGWRYVSTTFRTFFQQSRYGIVGLVVSWVQNQSIIPFLMILAGPLVVGYFSMARLLVMPISVVNQGLMKGITPKLRRVFKEHGSSRLTRLIAKLDLKNQLFSLFYLLVLLASHISGLFHRHVPEYEKVKLFLGIWGATLLVTSHRFWLSQFFIISMQFKYLMKVSLFALCVSLGSMLILGYGTRNAHVAFLAVAIGEFFVIYLFRKKQLAH